MSNSSKALRTTAPSREQYEELQRRLEEAEQALEAIHHGDVDALVITGPQGGRAIYSLTGAEHIYRVIVETMNEAALTVAPDGMILFCNQRFCDLTKTPLHEAMGRKVTAFTARPQQPSLKELLARAQAHPVQQRLILRAADGTVVPVQLSASPLQAGETLSLCLVASDLTELEESAHSIRVLREHEQAMQEANERLQAQSEELQVQAEELRAQSEELQTQAEELRTQTDELTATEAMLRKSEERLALALSGTRIGMYERDVATGKGQCTDYLAWLLGLRPLTPTTTPTALSLGYYYHAWTRLVHPEDLPRVEAELRRCMAERIPCEQDYRVIWPDGGVHWVADRGLFQYESDGRCVRILGVVMDVTERKRAEEALLAADRKYQALFDNQTAGLAYCQTVFDDNGRPVDYVILDVNHAYERSIGVRREQLVGKRVTEAFPGVSQDLIDRHNQVAVTGQSSHFEIPVPTLGMWFDVNVFCPERGYFIAISHNVTERKRAEEALKEWNVTLESTVAQRTAELRYRAKQLQKLTLDMSEAEDRERKRMAEILHDDLQQELAAAKFHLSLVRNRIKYDPSTQAITAQIEQMLKDAIGKSRSLSHELSPAVLHHGDFGETLRWLADEVQTKHGLVVHVHAQGRVRCESDALKGFLYKTARELLFNIIKHAGVSEARIRVRESGRHICLSVSDRGRGFDPQQLQEAAGFGLLSIRERIELLGGRMKIRSAKGRGSTFLIVVPDGQTPEGPGQMAPDGAVLSAAASVPGSVSSGRRLRILLADDHEIVREGFRSLLSDEHDVEVVGEAANGREAIELANRLKPDVIIMDVSMPLIDGDQATYQIKAFLPQTRVIAVSMYDQAEKIEAMRRAGAERYVLKTAPSEELLAAIRGQAQ